MYVTCVCCWLFVNNFFLQTMFSANMMPINMVHCIHKTTWYAALSLSLMKVFHTVSCKLENVLPLLYVIFLWYIEHNSIPFSRHANKFDGIKASSIAFLLVGAFLFVITSFGHGIWIVGLCDRYTVYNICICLYY